MWENRQVFRRDLEMGSDGELRTGWGRELQRQGAVCEKDLHPYLFSFDCGSNEGDSGGGSEGSGRAAGG